VVISGIPAGSQVAAVSRSEQPYLARLRASGDALEFGVADLALDAAGARQVYANAQVSLTPELAAELAERTEGWPAGLALAALIAKESHGQEQTVTGDDRYVADYLYREALIRQPGDIQRFLRRTAVLDQLSGPVCDAVLGSSGAARQLRRLEACGLFVIPLDRRREWYRYHALFREFLLGELRRAEPEIVVTLHQRAADWYEASGSVSLGLRLQLARVYLALADVATARQLLREIDDILIRRPALGFLVGEVEEFRVLADKAATGAAGSSPLTPAELRLVPYLQTHLTANGIAERLFVSSHTVKSEIKSIYRKLGVSSRNEAVQRALAIGLLGD
jgi:ATP/maltotriose-dependent transcriptional regulator MalT